MVLVNRPRHNIMLQVTDLLNSCDGCKRWEKASAKQKGKNLCSKVICKGCSTYKKLNRLGTKL